MDFSFTEDQQELRQLASRIFGDLSTHERLTELERDQSLYDARLWSELASAGLLGIGLPEEVGGAGLGFLEVCIVAEEAGRVAAAVPFVASLVLGAMPMARFGGEELKRRWLPGVVRGATILTAGLVEPGASPTHPLTTARPLAGGGSGWQLSGTKAFVPAGMAAHAMVVPATLSGSADVDDGGIEAGGVGLFVVDMTAPGVQRRPQQTTRGFIQAEVDLTDVEVGPESALALGGEATAALEWLLQVAEAAMCVEQAGACAAALSLTARYTSQRKQFDKAIATFQAVGQRAADSYIDTEAVRLTAWQAAWRLDRGLPAAAEVEVAKFWADEGAQRVVHACQHLHGGVGVDRDYPLHRYYLLTKELALTLGGSTTHLLRLGDILAAEPA